MRQWLGACVCVRAKNEQKKSNGNKGFVVKTSAESFRKIVNDWAEKNTKQ